METKTIEQKHNQPVDIRVYGGNAYVTQGRYEEISSIHLDEESLPAFHKAIGEFLPQVEVSEEAKTIKDKILEEYQKGNIVVAGIEGLQSMSLDDFVKQPVEGMLYDLNRTESVVLTFIDNPKWVNDYAVAKVIRKLYSLLSHSKQDSWKPVSVLPEMKIKVGEKYTTREMSAHCLVTDGEAVWEETYYEEEGFHSSITHYILTKDILSILPLPPAPTKGGKDE